ncbi:TVP38/TMEM64 family protein [Pseudahrensia aquimaris]|uniref:TVP38/TMEM64 family membrane protein n=1 Tax=Pseudahrensia aquimaris TaxID=744461 RepID=A0ABW3FCC7_9HYPH
MSGKSSSIEAPIAESNTQKAVRRVPWLKIFIGVAVIALLIFGYRMLPLQEWITAFQQWVQGYGIVGWFIFIVVYALTSFALLPGSFLTLAAGVIWGLGGFPIVVVGATIGSALSFLAARYLFKDKVQAKVAEYPKFNAVNQAIGEEGWKVVGLLRLSPALPFSLQNWFLGITPVGFLPSQIATFFGIMPGTLLYVWIGSLGGQAAGGDDMSVAKWIVGGLGIAATLLVTVLVTKKANAKLKEFAVD